MRILIADDNDIVRRGIVALLSRVPAWTICGEAVNGADTLQKTRELQPDLVLLDVSLPDANGLEITRRLRADFPTIRILVISQHNPRLLLPQAMGAGANGCLDKGCLGMDLLAAIEKIK
ncbi:MAG: response regulator transcription factor [Candidatus Sulfotelmatobacter sp.]